MANEVTYSDLLSNGGRVASVLSALLFEKIHDPTDLRAVMTEVSWASMGSDTLSVSLDGAPGAFSSTAETVAATNSDYDQGSFSLQIARYARQYQMTDLFGVTGGAIDAEAIVQTLADGVGLTMTDLVCSLFASLSTTEDAGATMVVDSFYDAVFALNLAGAASTPDAPFTMVLAPKQMNQFRSSLRGEADGSYLQYQAESAAIGAAKGPGYQGLFQGVDIWQSDSVLATLDASTHFGGAMFAKDCFAYTMAPVRALTGAHIPEQNVLIDAGELLVELDRDSSAGMTKAVASIFTGVAETQDALGVLIKSDI